MNNILGYYLMPHPPIIIPDIGRGEEKKIEKTSVACEKIGREIADIKPDTIVIVTPHGPMFSDAVAISAGKHIYGDLNQFRCSNIKISLDLDEEFVTSLSLKCHLEGIQSVLIDDKLLGRYGRKLELDHGSIVPLYFINKYYNDYKLVHITYSMIGDLNLYKLGILISNTAEELNRKTVFIASGDLSHKLKEEGPYSYSLYGPKFDKEFIETLENGDVVKCFNLDDTMVEESAQCGLYSVYTLLGSMQGNGIKGTLLSYEGPFGVGYGVMKFEPTSKDVDSYKVLKEYEENSYNEKIKNSNQYVKLARENLEHYFKYKKPINDLSNVDDELKNQKHGVFVSLKKFKNLRGCIGTIQSTTDNVAKEIIRNSIEAVIHDPRFPEVTEDELKDIDISVDVLMDAEISSKEELDPKKYGVIVTKGYKRGLLLPNLEGVNTIEDQLHIACDKAGIDYFNDDFHIERFEVIRYEE